MKFFKRIISIGFIAAILAFAFDAYIFHRFSMNVAIAAFIATFVCMTCFAATNKIYHVFRRIIRTAGMAISLMFFIALCTLVCGFFTQ